MKKKYGPPITSDSLKELADDLLATAKIILQGNGQLVPIVAAVMEDGQIGLFGIQMGEDKRATYRGLVEYLKPLRPVAAILLNDAYMRHYDAKSPEDAKDLAHYKQGDYVEDPKAKECIVISFKGPTFKPSTRTVPYIRNATGDIEYQPDSPWMEEGEVNILPDWWTP